MRSKKPTLLGVDTHFLVAYSVLEQPEHEQARALCEQLFEKNHLLALCPTVIDEFIHVVTDARRFERPLSMDQAVEVAHNWLTSRETVSLFPCEQSTRLQLQWLHAHRLGRERINDTRIASIYYQNGVRTLLTGNVRDYTIFDCFKIIRL